MSLYVSLEDTAETSLDELVRRARQRSSQDPALRKAYWTPDRGQLLSIYEGDESAAPTGLIPVLPITAEEYGPPALEPAAGDGANLQLVLVRRNLGPLTPREFRTIALQAIMCAYEYPDMRWLRSYWATGTDELHCLFRTRTHDLVREHADRSRIPCDEIHDAIELDINRLP